MSELADSSSGRELAAISSGQKLAASSSGREPPHYGPCNTNNAAAERRSSPHIPHSGV